MDDSDRERRRGEYLALTSIYEGVLGDQEDGPWQIPLDIGGAVLEVHLPGDYPSVSAPTPVLFAPTISASESKALVEELLGMFDSAEIVFTWTSHLTDALAEGEQQQQQQQQQLESAEASAEDLMAFGLETEVSEAGGASQEGAFTYVPPTSKYGQRVRHFGADALDERFAVEIVSGPSFHPPKSGPGESFQAHVAHVTCMGHVQWCLAKLLRDKRIARATHNMLAYKFVDVARGGVQVSDNDDDGESSSGAKLASLLELTAAQDVLVVVSRWFGGVLLGPARFKYIASTARQLLEETGHVGKAKGGHEGGARGAQKKGGPRTH